ncbi:unnamed protein product [Phytophthora fragariaefolia]|uniref:Unnamed protein product n=1 Tax=Phytophthora fragariaefolia TaxID=1490495 RepID=A0A9W7CUQ0_9STRA|nr:unnamed protein product [Phytophthora fragariaefolia]
MHPYRTSKFPKKNLSHLLIDLLFIGSTYKTKSNMPRRTSGRRLSAREQAEAVVAELQERRIELEQYRDHYSSRPLYAVEDDDTDTPIMDP